MDAPLPNIIITPGDPEGIGPEIAWKLVESRIFESRANLLCVGTREPFEKLGARVVIDPSGEANPYLEKQTTPALRLLPAPLAPPLASKIRSKRFSLAGFQAGWSIEKSVELIEDGKFAALVTGPISKVRLQKGGYPFQGHTDMLEALVRRRARHPSSHHKPTMTPTTTTMMLANEHLRVSLVTTHLPLSRVSRAITAKKITLHLENTLRFLIERCGIMHPRLAVLGLNPHAGEEGVLGAEEKKIIAPTLIKLRKKYSNAEILGPLPADSFFALNQAGKYSQIDAVLAMYHDQGLIPVKLLDFSKTVNLTLGLPFIRTSVDHGTAFDIAGKNLAKPDSLRAAVEFALKLLPKPHTT